MKRSSLVPCGFFLVMLVPTTQLIAEPPQEKFVANYVSLDNVTLSSPNGNTRSELKKGTLVAAKETGALLDVRTQDGRTGLASSRAFSRLGSSIQITAVTKAVAASSNQFAFDLYQRVRQRDGNLFFSPASISTALAMTYAGAAGQTEREMAAVLHFNREQNTHEGFSTLLALLNSTGDRNGYSLSTANRLWGAANYRFEQAFLSLTRDRYRAELETLDFGQPKQARTTINAWVEDQTRKKIVDLIPPGILNPDTRLVLTNAIYFASGWSSEFAQKATKNLPFHLTAKDELEVLTMQEQAAFPYAEDADVQVLSLPYRGGELSMVVVLPKQVDGLAQVEGKLTDEQFASWMQKLDSGKPVEVYLPKFRLRSQFMLSSALKSMGMASAFSEAADFSAMSNSESLMISAVIHQAFVDVDEKGTEAAAATAVIVAPTAAIAEPRVPPKPIVFRADHPFLFAIYDNRTGAVLFIGRMQRPEA